MRTHAAVLFTCLAAGALLPSQSNVWTIRTSGLPNLAGASMAYDGARTEVVLVGAGPTGFETWTWNGVAWSLRNPTTSPPARSGASLAYDGSRQELVLFGGVGAIAFADTWIWNGLDWAQRSTPFAPNPGSNSAQAMAFDPVRSRIALFSASQICEWDGNAWSNRTPSGYSASFVSLGQAVFEPAMQRILVNRFSWISPLSLSAFSWDGQSIVPLPSYASFGSGPIALHGGTGRLVSFRSFPSPGSTAEFVAGAWQQSVPVSWTCCLQGTFNPVSLAFDAARNQLIVYGTDQAGSIFATQGIGPVVASATVTGASCGSAGLGLVPVPADRPLVGGTARCRVTAVPTPVFVLTIGFSQLFYGPFPLPLPLDGIGMNGCILRHSADILSISLTPVGADLEYALVVPSTLQVLGFPLYLHAYGYAPSANPAQVAMTNRLDWIVGNQ